MCIEMIYERRHFVLYIYLFNVYLKTLKVYLFVQMSKDKLISSQFVGALFKSATLT